MSRSAVASPQQQQQQQREHVNIIHPDEGKRYKLNVRTPIARLTIGKVKQCLAAASSCPIPLEEMVLHLNGVPLSDDRDVCGSLGIGNGATLSVEARAGLPPYAAGTDAGHAQDSWVNGSPRSRSARAVAPAAAVASPPSPSHAAPPYALSDQRRLLELQTLQQQDTILHKDDVVRDDVLRHTLRHADDAVDAANLRRRQLERQREIAEEELRRMREKEVAAGKERERLTLLRAQEAARAAERAAQLAERREQLRAEQEAARAVAMLKLENEKKKAQLAQQQAFFDAERERAQLEQANFEAASKARELELRAREIDIEHQRLARIREARALDTDRRLAVQQRLHYYAQLGVEAPRSLQREAAALLLQAGSGLVEDDGDNEIGDDRTGLDSASLPSRLTSHRVAGPAAIRSGGADLNGTGVETSLLHHSDGLVRSRGASAAPGAAAAGAAVTQFPGNGAVTSVPEGSFYDARQNAEANLHRLGDDLGLQDRLQFDESDTCVISIDGEYTLLVTYDAATERLYLYSTLLASLPPVVQATPEGRLKLYEFLLEASLLGREMCGGGVGASLRNDFVLMSASLYMPTSQPWSLRTLAPQFLHCLRHWRTKLTEFLQTLEQQQQQQFVGYSPSSTSSAPRPSVARGTVPQPAPQQPPRATGPSSPAIHVASPASRTSAVTSPTTPSRTPAAATPSAPSPRVIPVLGLEVTGTVLVNGVPTHYEDGVLVVNAAGPSVLAGVQPNDFIEELNGVRIRNVADFRRVIEQQLEPDMLVPVRISRGGVAMVVTVRVEAAWSL